MPNETRDFKEELQEWGDLNITSERMKAIVDKIHETLANENPSIISIDTYFLMDNVQPYGSKLHGFRLYSVMTESIWKNPQATLLIQFTW